jgi:hypothetical protein
MWRYGDKRTEIEIGRMWRQENRVAVIRDVCAPEGLKSARFTEVTSRAHRHILVAAKLFTEGHSCKTRDFWDLNAAETDLAVMFVTVDSWNMHIYVFNKHNCKCAQIIGARGSVVLKALRYKPERRALKSGWGHWIFSIYLILPAALGPGDYSASNRKYQEYQNETNNVSGK